MFQNGVLPNTNCIGAAIAYVSCFDAGDNTQQLFVDGTAKVYFGLSSGHRLKILPNASGGQFDLSAVGIMQASRSPAQSGSISRLGTDYYLNIDTSGGAVAVTLEASPQTGATAIVLDKTGNAATSPITITPAAGNIDGSANVTINTAYGWWFGFYDGAKWKTVTRQPLVTTSQATPANPTGTTSTTGVMTGLAGSITPTVTGRILVVISGDVFNATAIADGAKLQLRTGTGTAPTNGAALTGTACGGNLNYVASTTAGKVPFSVACVVTGLSLGTAVWLDLGLAAISGGTATIENVGISAHEI